MIVGIWPWRSFDGPGCPRSGRNSYRDPVPLGVREPFSSSRIALQPRTTDGPGSITPLDVAPKPENVHSFEARMQGERSIRMEIVFVSCNPISGNVALCRR